MTDLLFHDLPQTYEPVMISLKRAWLERAIAGTKRHEFRRVFLREPVCAFVYVVAPDSIVSHVMWLTSPIVASPSVIAAIGEQERPGGGQSLLTYLGRRTVGYAAPIERVSPVAPLPLRELRSRISAFSPPQSYLLLRNNPDLLRLLMRQAKGVINPSGYIPA